MSDLTHRWANAAQTVVLRSDGASIPADPANSDFAALDLESIEPFRRFADIETAREVLKADVEAHASALRVAVAGTNDATKLAVYREKYTVAVAALSGDNAARAKLQAEADARGESVASLAALVKSLGDQWTGAGLAIDAAHQSHKAAIGELGMAGAEAYDVGAGWPF